MWVQREITLDARPRGFHLVTREVVGALPELGDVSVGLLQLLIQHTSASLALNENASPDVRRDFETYFNEAVPEDAPFCTRVTIQGSLGSVWCAPTGRWPRAIASGGCSTRRGCRSAVQGSTCG